MNALYDVKNLNDQILSKNDEMKNWDTKSELWDKNLIMRY